MIALGDRTCKKVTKVKGHMGSALVESLGEKKHQGCTRTKHRPHKTAVSKSKRGGPGGDIKHIDLRKYTLILDFKLENCKKYLFFKPPACSVLRTV